MAKITFRNVSYQNLKLANFNQWNTFTRSGQCVSKEARSTKFTAKSDSVIETSQAFSSGCVTITGSCWLNVVVTNTFLASTKRVLNKEETCLSTTHRNVPVYWWERFFCCEKFLDILVCNHYFRTMTKLSHENFLFLRFWTFLHL